MGWVAARQPQLRRVSGAERLLCRGVVKAPFARIPAARASGRRRDALLHCRGSKDQHGSASARAQRNRMGRLFPAGAAEFQREPDFVAGVLMVQADQPERRCLIARAQGLVNLPVFPDALDGLVLGLPVIQGGGVGVVLSPL